ncbi:MAG: hypothetical protein JEZ14_17825 [Marinilabiliaceae bacterium]|nr:hypothetical protein [Marinilabiliaceae bacterium]
MKNLLNQLNKVVNQVQSHHTIHQCSTREHAAIKSTLSDLNNLTTEHKEKLQSLPADPLSEKKLKYLYRSYQKTLVRLLNTLYKFQSTCRVNREKETCLKRKAIKTLTELLCFLREQFPHAFDTTLNIPSSVYQTQKEQLHQSLILIKSTLVTKRVNRLLLKTVTHPITDFLDNNKEHYTFSDLTYLHSWMNKLAIVCTKSHTSSLSDLAANTNFIIFKA